MGSSNGATGVTYDLTWTYNDGITTRTNSATGLTNPSYSHEGLVTGTSYSYSVVARNVCGPSGASSSFAMVAGTRPSDPTNIRSNCINQDTTEIVWTAASPNGYPITGYQVMVRGSDSNYRNVVNLCTEYVNG